MDSACVWSQTSPGSSRSLRRIRPILFNTKDREPSAPQAAALLQCSCFWTLVECTSGSIPFLEKTGPPRLSIKATQRRLWTANDSKTVTIIVCVVFFAGKFANKNLICFLTGRFRSTQNETLVSCPPSLALHARRCSLVCLLACRSIGVSQHHRGPETAFFSCSIALGFGLAQSGHSSPQYNSLTTLPKHKGACAPRINYAGHCPSPIPRPFLLGSSKHRPLQGGLPTAECARSLRPPLTHAHCSMTAVFDSEQRWS